MNCSNAVKRVWSVSRPCVALAMPKSITLGTGTPSLMVTRMDVRGLDVAVNDALLVRVLDGLTDLYEELKPVCGRKFVLIAELGDFDSAHQFHDEIGAAGRDRGTLTPGP